MSVMQGPTNGWCIHGRAYGPEWACPYCGTEGGRGGPSYRRIEAAVLAAARERVRALPVSYQRRAKPGTSNIWHDVEVVTCADVLRVLSEPDGATAVAVSAPLPRGSPVTPRELAALAAYLREGSAIAAARSLGRSPETVRNQLASVRSRLGVRRTAQAALILADDLRP